MVTGRAIEENVTQNFEFLVAFYKYCEVDSYNMSDANIEVSSGRTSLFSNHSLNFR